MKSDWDDAPPRLKASKGNGGVGSWLFAVILGTGFGVGLLYLAGIPIPFLQNSQPVAQIEQLQEEPSSLPAFEEPDPNQPTAEEMFWSSVKQQETERKARIKQTDYNDQNYTPRQPHNVVSMEGVRQSSAYQQPAQQTSTRRTAIEQDTQVVPKWSGGGGYFASWTVVNNYIDGGTVCSNHKRGSIDYRECRKGAKQFFKNECRAWGERWQNDREPQSDRMKQRYCSAASSFSPMS
ncbi:hypothetical protein NNO07_07385 [Pseudomonas resinovorans]|uniref:Uncharacterized protein n=1 Tax=Metapseudomonas resinovorans TaxID=53412 RepID=A0ABT4Y224_METRE|nr:hypothetical protein [Pseudomonas resinovorans]MDA8482887.1 hypothetical protein [Pseudomonas resinovorans]